MFSAAKWLDLARRWAYLRGVDSPQPDKQAAAPHKGPSTVQRRRPATGAERARRDWLMADLKAHYQEHVKRYKKDGG